MGSPTPREYFAAVFETVLEEIDRNPEFAARLSSRLGDRVELIYKPAKKGPASVPSELADVDLKAMRAEIGHIELGERFSTHSNAVLRAFVKERGLASGPLSKKNKTQLVNIIVRASK
ncbi:MAG: hypothetical protein AAFQ73_09160 [Pseudomonadota bacterium]